MAMVACRECNAQISSKAKVCPHCGIKRRGKKLWLWIPLGIVGIIFLLGVIGASLPPREPFAIDRHKPFTGRMQTSGGLVYVLLNEPSPIDGDCTGWNAVSVQGVDPGSSKFTNLMCWRWEGDMIATTSKHGGLKRAHKSFYAD